MYEERTKRLFISLYVQEDKNEMETTRKRRQYDDNGRIDASSICWGWQLEKIRL